MTGRDGQRRRKEPQLWTLQSPSLAGRPHGLGTQPVLGLPTPRPAPSPPPFSSSTSERPRSHPRPREAAPLQPFISRLAGATLARALLPDEASAPQPLLKKPSWPASLRPGVTEDSGPEPRPPLCARPQEPQALPRRRAQSLGQTPVPERACPPAREALMRLGLRPWAPTTASLFRTEPISPSPVEPA